MEAAEDDGSDLIESYVAMGGDADTGGTLPRQILWLPICSRIIRRVIGCIQADKLRAMVSKFELAIDIEALIKEV